RRLRPDRGTHRADPACHRGQGHPAQLRLRPQRQPHPAAQREREHHLDYLQLPRPSQAITEPQAGRYTSAADTTTTNAYDADGNLTQQTLPGGVQITSSYDPMGRLLTESGNGATAATASRTYTYDDRGLLLAAAGSAGTSSFGYNASAQLTSDTGPSGTSTYTYNAAGLLAT